MPRWLCTLRAAIKAVQEKLLLKMEGSTEDDPSEADLAEAARALREVYTAVTMGPFKVDPGSNRRFKPRSALFTN